MADGSKVTDKLAPEDKERQKVDQTTRIATEEKRLRISFKNIDEDKKRIVDGLIRRASFMRVTLEDLEEDIKLNGCTEWFTQSDNVPPYERKRPTVEIYNQTIKNYQTTTKQLSDLLQRPGGSGGGDDGFDKF